MIHDNGNWNTGERCARCCSWKHRLAHGGLPGAGVLFILSLGGLSSQESAKRGDIYGMIGMVVALAATMLNPRITAYELTANSALVGAIGVAV